MSTMIRMIVRLLLMLLLLWSIVLPYGWQVFRDNEDVLLYVE